MLATALWFKCQYTTAAVVVQEIENKTLISATATTTAGVLFKWWYVNEPFVSTWISNYYKKRKKELRKKGVGLFTLDNDLNKTTGTETNKKR